MNKTGGQDFSDYEKLWNEERGGKTKQARTKPWETPISEEPEYIFLLVSVHTHHDAFVENPVATSKDPDKLLEHLKKIYEFNQELFEKCVKVVKEFLGEAVTVEDTKGLCYSIKTITNV